MRGFSNIINSAQDMANLLAMPEYAEQARKKLLELRDARQVWQVTGQLEGEEPGLTGPTNKLVGMLVDGQVTRHQMELREDPGAAYNRLGLAALETEGLLAEAGLPAGGITAEGGEDA